MKPRRSRTRIDNDEPLNEPPDERPRHARRSAPGGGKRRKLFMFFALMVVVIGLLPTIVAKTPLRNVVLSAALPTNQLRVSVGDASLGWLSAPSLAEVQVRDAAGDALLMAESIRIDRTPANLFFNSHELGVVEIVRPSIYLKTRGDGSNLEDSLRQLLAEVANDVPEPDAVDVPSPPVAVVLKIVAATVLIDDTTTGRRWRVEGLDLQYDTHGANGGLGHGKLVGQIVDIGPDNAVLGSAGRFAATIEPADGGKCRMSLQSDALSLALTVPWLQRFVAGAELAGTLSGQGTAEWTLSTAALPADFTTSGSLSIDRLDAAAAALAGDRIRLARVELPWRLAAQPAGLVIDDLQLRSEIGQVAVRGTIDPAAFAQAPTDGAAVADAVARHAVEMRGSLDLVALAKMLPRALKIREGTTITSGSIQLAARAEPADGGQLFTGSLQTAQLAAIAAGRPIRWDQPVSAGFALRRAQGTLRLDSLKCDSDFLKVDASGTPQQMAATAQFDLNRLAEQLGQFVDLSGVALAGTGTAKLDWRQTAPGEFSGTVTGQLAQLRVALGGGEASTEKTDFAADLHMAGDAVDIANGKLVVVELRANSPGWNINEPRAELSGDAHWNRATGEISANTAQLVSSAVSLATKGVRYVAPQQNGGQSGVGQLTGMAAFRADLARLAAWRVSAEQPPTYQPSGALTGNARFLQQADRLTGEVEVTGQNVALAQWIPASPANRGAGTAAERGSAPAGAAPAQAGYQTIWQEPQVNLHTLATYESASDRLAFDQFQVQSNTLQASVTGHIEKLSTAADIKLSGTLNYDLAQITPLLRPYVGSGIQLVGREQAQFALAGPIGESQGSRVENQRAGASPPPILALVSQPSTFDLPHWSHRVQGRLELPWAGANVYGLPIGAGRLAATLGEGIVRIDPLSLAVGEGQLTAAPNIRLDPSPSELTLPQGPLITNVRISTEVSEALLKYVAPVLAGATQSEGQFSLALEATRVPLGEPKKADSSGQLTVHSVRVVPGPLAAQWVGLAQQIESLIKRRDPASQPNRSQVTLLSVRDQQVNFRVVDGRVHHQNMEFQVGDVILRSQGSVGLDETIALTLSVPIQDAWIAKEPLLVGFKGQSLQIPVSGTLMRPQMDPRAVASITQQLLQGAAQQAVGGELNKALDKLFKSR
jgi:hypothetical protein